MDPIFLAVFSEPMASTMERNVAGGHYGEESWKICIYLEMSHCRVLFYGYIYISNYRCCRSSTSIPINIVKSIVIVCPLAKGQ
jgi:hypothetical protein